VICNHIARLGADGNLDTGFVSGLSPYPSFSLVSSIAVQSDLKVVVGLLDGVSRLNVDGTLDRDFALGRGYVPTDSLVESVVLQGGQILIGGWFTNVSYVSRNYIARLNADGTPDVGFANGLSGANSFVHAIAVQSDGKILIGGSFSTVNGVARNAIARLNTDGSLDTGFHDGLSGGYGSMSSVAVQSDGKMLIGGWFTTANGAGGGHIGRLNSDGTLDSGFRNGQAGASDDYVLSLLQQSDGKVLIGGFFTTVNGVSRNNIARLNADGTLDSGFQYGLSGSGGTIWSVAAQSDGKVLIGGSFINGVSSNSIIERLNADGTVDSNFQNGMSGAGCYAASVAVQIDGKVLIGGNFTTVNGVGRTNIARLNADGTLDSGFHGGLSGVGGPISFSYRRISSVAVQSDGKVLIGGSFGTVNDVSRSNIARLNADGSLDSAFQMGLSGADYEVRSIVVQPNGQLLIGGSFTYVNGVRRLGIARLNADGTLDNGFLNGLAGANGSVFAVAVQSDGKVLIGGFFTTVNGVSRTNIARLSADGTLDSGFQNGLSGVGPIAYPRGTVFSLAAQSDGNVLLGGWFSTVNGVPAANFARLWGDTPPFIHGVSRSGTGASLGWDSISNRIYRVQYKENVSAADWTNLAGDVAATGAAASKTDTTLSGAAPRFYRVVLLP
jgi:uncharacterized delta-60 repeat protein